MLNINDADFAEQFREALGLKAGETAQFVTPQFERTDGVVPVSSVDSWEALRTREAGALKALGCGQWSDPDKSGRALMLFPREWYSKIPDGYAVEFIDGTVAPFKHGDTDDDYRFGCLAFGVRVSVEENGNGD